MEKLPIVVYNKFLGVFSNFDTYDLPRGDGAIALKTGTNIDINQFFKIKFRDGRAKKLTGDYKNIWSNGSVIFATLGEDLYKLTLDLSDLSMTATTAKLGVGLGTMNYESIGDITYMTNDNVILAHEDDVIRDLRTTTITFRKTMPPGYLLELHRGRMFIAKTIQTFGDNSSNVTEYKRDQEVVINSDARSYEMYDTRDDKSWQSFPTKLTMMKSVHSGMFISADKTYYVEGSAFGKMKLNKVDDLPAIKGTPAKVRGATIGGEYYDNAALWETEAGICVGGSGGKFKYLTKDRKAKSTALRGASYIKRGVINQYVSNTKG
jgi:hypothetical protein